MAVDPAQGARKLATAGGLAACVVLISVAIGIPAALLIEGGISAVIAEQHAHALDAAAQDVARSLSRQMNSWVREVQALAQAPALRDPAGPAPPSEAAVAQPGGGTHRPERQQFLTDVAPASTGTDVPGWSVVAREPMRNLAASAPRVRNGVALGCAGVGTAAGVIAALAALRRKRSRPQSAPYDLLSAERNARSQAERVARMKDEFLAVLSHELRTPLNAIMGWAQLLESGKLDSAGVRHATETIRRNVAAQVLLVESLLDMSRIDSGKLRLRIMRVDLAATVRDAVATLMHAASTKRLQLQVLATGEECTVEGDPDRLHQVVTNLLSNAIKFTEDAGQITVSLRRAAGTVELEIADNGVGINPGVIGHIFERFQQADRTAARRYGGLGLGLSIAKNLVELHGGTICAQSEGEGKGATFIVSLPNARPTDASAAPTPSVHRPAADRLDGVRVLVIDDEPDARELIARCLSDEGAEAVPASNAAEAMECLCWKGPFSALISDIGMPDEDGMSLMKRIRAMPVFREIPAIALTAYARDIDRQSALAAGYQAHLGKPVDVALLLSELARLVGQGREQPRPVNA